MQLSDSGGAVSLGSIIIIIIIIIISFISGAKPIAE